MEKEIIHEKCKGCGKVMEDSTCSVYPKPRIWWNRGTCPIADHIKIETKSNGKVRVGQQKQKRRKR
jgi:hypothetical protein